MSKDIDHVQAFAGAHHKFQLAIETSRLFSIVLARRQPDAVDLQQKKMFGLATYGVLIFSRFGKYVLGHVDVNVDV